MLCFRADPFCEEALSALVDNHMLTNKQELDLIDRLPLQPEDRWLALLYRAKCKKVRPAGIARLCTEHAAEYLGVSIPT
jgi:hypothetical protein